MEVFLLETPLNNINPFKLKLLLLLLLLFTHKDSDIADNTTKEVPREGDIFRGQNILVKS